MQSLSAKSAVVAQTAAVRSIAPHRCGRLATLSLLASLAAASAGAQSSSVEHIRAEFKAAYTASSNGVSQDDADDSAELRAYVLYPYIQAARITRALLDVTVPESSVDDRAMAFIEQHRREPVGPALHRTWLTSLARREAWSQFVAHYDSAVATTRQQCQYLSARATLADTANLEELITSRWLSPGQLPGECEAAFQWLRERGVLDASMTEQRTQLLLERGQASFARIIARRLPPERAAPYLRWSQLIQNPAVEFDKLLSNPQIEVMPRALVSAWSLFAKADPAAAAERMELLLATRDIGTAVAGQLMLDLALGLAWDRRGEEALAWFDRVDPGLLDDYSLGWLARAALWTGRWTAAEVAIMAMSPQIRAETVWQYWRARALLEAGSSEAAEQILQRVLHTDNFYASLAAALLGQPIRLESRPVHRTASENSLLQDHPSLNRARELRYTGLRTEATREWLFAIGPMSDVERTQSIHLASDWEWYEMAVALATQQEVFDDYQLLYPAPFGDVVNSAAHRTGLSPELIYAVMRQESLFREDAVSPTGAIGLAQLLPETAGRTAELWSIPKPSREELFEPAINVTLGAATLKSLLADFDDQLPVALAAYNAGPSAAGRWLPDQAVDADVWIENIPYNETREYVQRVLWHSVVYGWLQSGDAQDTSEWLKRVARTRDH